ncbi:MAG: DegV family protein [Bacillota bacterium]|nr:DegV family protein [Bacillota bacterium]
MREFVITTDSDSEIPYDYAEKNGVEVFLMPYTFNEKEYLFDCFKNMALVREFFQGLKEGAKTTTSARSPHEIYEFFKDIVSKGKDVINIALSSKLSNHYIYACMARDDILKEYPEAKVAVIDSINICIAQGMMVFEAVEMKRAGKTLEEVVERMEKLKSLVNLYFTVDDLNFLKRGGRVSGAAAAVGTMLDLKPIIYCDKEGKLVPIDKVKGKKKAIKYFVDRMAEDCAEAEKKSIYIVEAECEEDAKLLEIMIRERSNPREVIIRPMGPVIGSHTGPGALGLCFIGVERI